MRDDGDANGVSVRAYAGTTGVLLAMNVRDDRRTGLLGFAIEREGGNRPRQFLSGLLQFPDVTHRAGELVTTDRAPVQKFRWSDYRVFPGTRYTYTVHPVYGTPANPTVEAGPRVTMTTEDATSGVHRVLFNRAAAASQAFTREFPAVEAELDLARREKREPVLPAEALDWLSRGLLEQITDFCARATDSKWALDVAIYELELPEIVKALKDARERGAAVRIVYHARPGDPQTTENEHALTGWPPAGLRARVTSKICHHKFAVLSRVEGAKRKPVAVLCGSTNFTHNGVYRQANVTHIIERQNVALTYAKLFEGLFAGDSASTTRAWIDANNALGDTATVVGFSPRSKKLDLTRFITEIGNAKRDVLFCTAFDLNTHIYDALLGAPNDDIVRIGLQNTRSRVTGVHRDRTASFTATAMIGKGLEGYLKESTAGQKGNILIHTKLIVVDFTSDSPTIISGSHNFSGAASGGNDENYLILRGPRDVADCYGVELMRLYEHYRARHNLKPKPTPDSNEPPNPCPRRRGTLCPDDRWTIPYFTPGRLESVDRERFGIAVGS